MGCTQGKTTRRRNSKIENYEQKSDLKSQFEGKNIFITGGTGYFGKTIIEKLLRSYQTVGCIYVLVRAKGDLSAQQNFEKNLQQNYLIQQLDSKIVQQKLKFIEGDISKENLGLSDENIVFIKENIHYIIHCAASLDFSPPLIQNTLMNIKPTLQLYEIAKHAKNLEHFVYVSSTFSQGDKSGLIEERIFPNQDHKDPEQLYNYILNNDLSKQQQQQIIGDFPNCYCFTKNLCEQILQKRQNIDKNMTVSVFRPSIILSLNEEPIPGYIDQLIGMGVVHYYIGTGQLKQFYVDKEMIIDAIPCDVAVSQLIMTLGLLANNKQINVINSGTSHQNPLKNKLHFDICEQFWKENRAKKAKNLPQCEYTTDFSIIKEKHDQMKQMAQQIPDEKIKSINLGLIEKSLMLNLVYKNINSHEMIFESKSVYKMAQYLGKDDKQILNNWDVKKIDWQHAITIFEYGLQKFILKEDIKLPKVQIPEQFNSACSTD